MGIVEKLKQWSDTEWTKAFGIGDEERPDALRLCDDCAEAAAYIQELERCREDAERYRALRKNTAWYAERGRALWGEELDDAVDALRSCGK